MRYAKLIILILMYCMALPTQGQELFDTIVKADGTKMQVFVYEVQKRVVKYEYPIGSGIISSIPRKDIVKIVYADGQEDFFESKPMKEEYTSSIRFAQKILARIELNKGDTLIGPIIEITPASHIMIYVDDLETRIEMCDIQNIEGIATSSSISNKETGNVYPESCTLMFGPYEIEMALIPGATFSMGYDGHGSRAMSSEPVHDVTLSSFYVNVHPLENDLIDYLNDNENKTSLHLTESFFNSVESLAKMSSVPVKLITEAQWEFIATTDNLDKIDIAQDETNLCQDYFDEYRQSSIPPIDPKGPKLGSSYVIRSFIGKVYHRYNSKYIDYIPGFMGYINYRIRFTFQASDLFSIR